MVAPGAPDIEIGWARPEECTVYRIALYEGAAAGWNDFARRHGTVFHRWEWFSALCATLGYGARPLAVHTSGGDLAGLLPLCVVRGLSLRRAGVSLPFTAHLDPCCASDGARRHLADALPTLSRALGLHHVELRLSQPLPTGGEGAVNTDNVTFRLPLHLGAEALLARASADNRRRTRLADRRGRFVVSDDWRHLEAFHRVLRTRHRQLGSPTPGLAFFRTIRDAFPHEAVLLTVHPREGGGVLGGMFLLADGATLYYLWGAADARYVAEHINVYMYREAIAWSIRRGFSQLDLGRSPRSEAGTYRFKEQFGAEPIPLWYYRLRPGATGTWANPQTTLRPAVAIWKRLPAAVANVVGPVVSRYIAP